MTQDFFRNNMPYGMQRNDQNEWIVFNRENFALGHNPQSYHPSVMDKSAYTGSGFYSLYPKLTEQIIQMIIGDTDLIYRNAENEITRFFFYNDRTYPVSNVDLWKAYCDKLETFCRLTMKSV